MSTLEELRRTLDQHAEGVRDDGVHHRAADVRRRGQLVRRRRRVGAGIAAVAAVAVGSAVVALPGSRSPQPADRELLGMTAPATLSSLGYTYDFSRGIEGTATRTTVTVAASDEARLLTWADRGAGRIRVRTADNRTIVSRGDFQDFVMIPPGFEGTWTVEGADTAAAVYDLDPSQPPDGVTRDGITFRADVLDHRLVEARIGEAGEPDLSGSVRLPAGRAALASFCTGGDEHTWVHAEVEGAVGSFGANCTAPVFDPGGTAESQFRWPTTGTTTVRIWATDGQHGPVVTDPDVRLGFGLYSLGNDTLEVAGYRLEQQVEYDGHVWGMPRPIESHPGDRSLAVPVFDRGGPSLVVATFSHTGGPVYTKLAGVSGAAFAGTRLGGATTLGVAEPGTRPSELRIHGTVNPRARLGLAFYLRLD